MTASTTDLPPAPAHWSYPKPGTPDIAVQLPWDPDRLHTEHDFARIVTPPSADPDCDGCEECEQVNPAWTPRNADLLYLCGVLIVDEVREILETSVAGTEQWRADVREYFADLLPPVALEAAAASPTWLERFLGCFRDLLDRMATGQEPRPLCTGEEMALLIMVNAACDRYNEFQDDLEGPWQLDDTPLHMWPEVEAALPHCEGDYDLQGLYYAVIDDTDVLFLFDEQMADLAHAGSILHPDHWFDGFYGQAVAPLEAGFDR